MLNDACGFKKVFLATGYTDYPRSIIIREDCCNRDIAGFYTYVINDPFFVIFGYFYFINSIFEFPYPF